MPGSHDEKRQREQDAERSRKFFASPAGARLVKDIPDLNRLLASNDVLGPQRPTKTIRQFLEGSPADRLRKSSDYNAIHWLRQWVEDDANSLVVFAPMTVSVNQLTNDLRLVQDPADLGQLVRSARKTMHMSQQRFADLAGVGRRFLSELESGKPSLELGKVLQACRAAGIDLVAMRR